MTMRRSIILAAAVVIGAGAYAVTIAARSSRPTPGADTATTALLDWANVSADQRELLRGKDPTFAQELTELRGQVTSRRAELASTLEKVEASDEEILQSVERVIEAENALERRVTRYLLNVREHLTPEQQRRLFCLCAERVRECGQQRRGMPGGRGPGMGMGPQWGSHAGPPAASAPADDGWRGGGGGRQRRGR